MKNGSRETLAFVGRKVLSLFFVIIIVLTLQFLFFRVGLPIDRLMQGNAGELYDVHKESHLDEPLIVQYPLYLADMLTGHGIFDVHSFVTRSTIGNSVGSVLLYTLMLFSVALFSSFMLGLGIQRLLRKVKRRALVATGSGVALFLWVVPVVSVTVLVVLEIVDHMSTGWMHPVPRDYSSMNLLDRAAAFLQPRVFPILILIAASVGGFVLVIAQGYRNIEAKIRCPNQELEQAKPRLSEAMLSVIPSLKFNIALIMSCVILLEIWFTLPGLGRYFVNGFLNGDYVLVEATSYVMILMTLLAGFCFDLFFSVVAIRTAPRETHMQSALDEAGPSRLAPEATESLLHRILNELRWFAKGFFRSLTGIVGSVLFVAMMILAIVGPSMAGSTSSALPATLDPVSVFLSDSRGPFLYLLGITLLSLVIGLGVGVLASPLGRWNYPVRLLAEATLAFPIVVSLVAFSLTTATDKYSSVMQRVIPAVFVAWSPVALAVLWGSRSNPSPSTRPLGTHRKFGKIGTSLLEATYRGLPHAIAATKFAVVISAASIVLADFLFQIFVSFQVFSWAGMIRYSAMYMLQHGVDLWFVLPTVGFVLLVSGFFLVLHTVGELVGKRNRTEA